MLSLFRINDPSRAIFLLGLAIVLRVPFLIPDLPVLHDQALWMALGEAFKNGTRLYSEIWTTEPPVFAWIESLIIWVFSKSQTGQLIAGVILVWISAVIFNSILAEIEAFQTKSYVPGAIFVLLASASFEYLIISPQLLAMPFLLASLKFLFPFLRGEPSHDRLFLSGIFFSAATAIYLQTIYILPFYLLFLLFGTGSRPNMMIWWLGSFLFFWLTLGFNYWLKSDFGLFADAMLFGLKSFISSSFWEVRAYFAVFAPILFLLLIAVFNLVFRYRFLNYHVRIQRSFFALALFILFSMVFISRLSFLSFYFLIIPIAYFLSQYFLELRKSMWNEIIFSGLFLLSIGLNLALISDSIIFSGLPKEARSYSWEGPDFKNKKVLVLGEAAYFLRDNQLSGPFLDWEYSQKRIEKMDEVHFHSILRGVIERESPERIIDPQGLFQKLIKKDVGLAKSYTRYGSSSYFRE